jgi:hypothetical protein
MSLQEFMRLVEGSTRRDWEFILPFLAPEGKRLNDGKLPTDLFYKQIMQAHLLKPDLGIAEAKVGDLAATGLEPITQEGLKDPNNLALKATWRTRRVKKVGELEDYQEVLPSTHHMSHIRLRDITALATLSLSPKFSNADFKKQLDDSIQKRKTARRSQPFLYRV